MANTALDIYLDLVGQQFERLTVTELVDAKTKHGRPNSQSTWRCKCSCGGERVAVASVLVHGLAQSCGCMKREAAAKLWERRKSGSFERNPKAIPSADQYSPEYRAWTNIKQRCYNPRHAAYKNYGGRGILVCEHWVRNFKQFLADVGSKPSPDHSINRIDNEKSYLCPICLPPDGNCNWVTDDEQNKNRRPFSPDGMTGKHMARVWAERNETYREQFGERVKTALAVISSEARERRRQGGIKGGTIGGPIGSRRRWDKVAEQKIQPTLLAKS
jgi:hypothetical protein